jgi:hypothetical protein
MDNNTTSTAKRTTVLIHQRRAHTRPLRMMLMGSTKMAMALLLNLETNTSTATTQIAALPRIHLQHSSNKPTMTQISNTERLSSRVIMIPTKVTAHHNTASLAHQVALRKEIVV